MDEEPDAKHLLEPGRVVVVLEVWSGREEVQKGSGLEGHVEVTDHVVQIVTRVVPHHAHHTVV